jgi:hypothetical protein
MEAVDEALGVVHCSPGRLVVSCVRAARPDPDGPHAVARARDTFDAWMARLSNAGRWGAEDELGTLNLIRRRPSAAPPHRASGTASRCPPAREVAAGSDSTTLFPFRLRAYSRPFDSTITAPPTRSR